MTDRPLDLTDQDDLDLLAEALLLVGESIGVARFRGLLHGNAPAALAELDTPELANLVKSWADAGVDVRGAVERYVSRQIAKELERDGRPLPELNA